MEARIAHAFPTLIGRFRLPDAAALNCGLRELVLGRERIEANVGHANVGGWHSAGNFLETAHPCVAQLRTAMSEAVGRMVDATLDQLRQAGIQRSFGGSMAFMGWANVSRRGHYHALHNHPGSCWSGAYYVDVGGPAADEGRSGVLDLLDPRPFTEMVPVPGDPYGQKISVRPEAGMMLVFPGFLYHFVHPHQGDGERISIAFNARVERRQAHPRGA